MSIASGLVVLAIGAVLTAAGLLAWSGGWHVWATPGIASHGLLPLLALPAGLMCLSMVLVVFVGSLSDNVLLALVVLPVFAVFLVTAAITIPGIFLLFFWSPKRVPDRIRPRWLPPTWTPPAMSFTTFSRPSMLRELTEQRPAGPYWPAKLTENFGPGKGAPPRYGFFALGDEAMTWFDYRWDSPECKESFTVPSREITELDLHHRRALANAPVTLTVLTATMGARVDVFTGLLSYPDRMATEVGRALRPPLGT